MSKSILLAMSLEKATEAETGLQLGDDVLTILYATIQGCATDYPVMWKIIHDFYGDVQVDPSELHLLLGELQRLLDRFTASTEAAIWLRVLQTLSEMGIEHSLSLFGIAD